MEEFYADMAGLIASGAVTMRETVHDGLDRHAGSSFGGGRSLVPGQKDGVNAGLKSRMAHLPPWRSRRIRVRCGRAFTTLAGGRRIIRVRDGKVAGRCRWSNDHDAVQGLLRHPGRRAQRGRRRDQDRSEEHTSELQSLMRISYAV